MLPQAALKTEMPNFRSAIVDSRYAVGGMLPTNVLVTVEHMKDGPEGDVIASRKSSRSAVI
jgi:hypothetical protein